MFGRFLSRQSKPKDVAAELGVDLHSHLIPGVDDGVSSVAEALACLAALAERGFRGAVTTPHQHEGVFMAPRQQLHGGLDDVRRAIHQAAAGMGLALAAEYHVDPILWRTLVNDPANLLAMELRDDAPGGSVRRLILLELGPMALSNVDLVLADCHRLGFTPVIAHAERCALLQEGDAVQTALAWREDGALLQMNLGSPVGQYGKRVAALAQRLWKADCIDLVGSDMHRPADIEPVEEGLKWLGAERQRLGRLLNGRLVTPYGQDRGS